MPSSGAGRFDQPFTIFRDSLLRQWRVMGPGWVYPPTFSRQTDALDFAAMARAADAHLVRALNAPMVVVTHHPKPKRNPYTYRNGEDDD